MRYNFKAVRNALIEKTRDTNNTLTLVRGAVDARYNDNGYTVMNLHTNDTFTQYKTLKEVVEEFDLKF